MSVDTPTAIRPYPPAHARPCFDLRRANQAEESLSRRRLRSAMASLRARTVKTLRLGPWRERYPRAPRGRPREGPFATGAPLHFQLLPLRRAPATTCSPRTKAPVLLLWAAAAWEGQPLVQSSRRGRTCLCRGTEGTRLSALPGSCAGTCAKSLQPMGWSPSAHRAPRLTGPPPDARATASGGREARG